MPSIRYYNQTAPFWDWVASMESAAGDHPFFNAYAAHEEPRDTTAPRDDAPPPPPEYDGAPPPPAQPSCPPPPPEAEQGWGHFAHRHGGPPGCGGWGRPHGRGGFGGRGRHGGFPFGGPPHHRGPWGRRHGPGGPFDMNALTAFLSQRFGFDTSDETETPAPNASAKSADKDFTPPVDVFDTPDAYIVHVSLPGAKKEDVGVNWDGEKSELSVAGVVYRIGDEEMVKALAMGERDVGVFERKVRLGSRAHPAGVEADGITARMEEGVLVVRVPKVEEFVEVKKVDVE